MAEQNARARERSKPSNTPLFDEILNQLLLAQSQRSARISARAPSARPAFHAQGRGIAASSVQRGKIRSLSPLSAPSAQPQAGALIISPQPTLTGTPSPTRLHQVDGGAGFAGDTQGGTPIGDRSGFFEGPRDTPPRPNQGSAGGQASGGNAITPR